MQHGRAGRHLGHGDDRAVALGDGGDNRADPLRDRVALVRALVLADEIDLQVGDIGPAAHEVVPHESVEIEGRGGAGIDLDVADLGLAANSGGHFAGNAGGLLQRGALGRVDHDLELRLVVEGQHLDLHRPEADQAYRGEQQAHNGREEDPAPAGMVEQRLHHLVIEARKPVIRRMVVIVNRRRLRRCVT